LTLLGILWAKPRNDRSALGICLANPVTSVGRNRFARCRDKGTFRTSGVIAANEIPCR